ncbi:hypothetical protein DAI22_03g052766 [Oryza sativa Japonica Group]|nr:hypothetical protein DAI22_03g052766 [Oryza sativa Japonica Group]
MGHLAMTSPETSVQITLLEFRNHWKFRAEQRWSLLQLVSSRPVSPSVSLYTEATGRPKNTICH